MMASVPPLPTLWVGVGHAGCRMLTSMRGFLAETPELAVVHTRADVLAQTGIARAVVLPAGPAGGTGGDPAVGERAATEVLGELREMMHGFAVVVLLVGLGGGTGSGAVPVVARAAREAGAFVLALATLPFMFEGPRRNQVARQSLAALQAAADVVIAFPNQRLAEWVPDGTPLQQTFQFADHVVGASLDTLWRLLVSPAILPVDLSDLARLAADHTSLLAMASVETSGERRVESAVEELLRSPLLDHGALLAASPAVLVGVAGGAELTLRELQRLAEGLRANIRSDATLTLGATVADREREGRITVTLLAAEPAESPALPTGSRGRTETPAAIDRLRQPELQLAAEMPNRFDGVSPTVRDGVNVDVPTFLRRNIRLSTSVRG
ncbi:MAG: hypothetical protein N2652_00100 [Kiritimatiellae bacterium]|nr:hypothetical protein [Kiritimatiellia bacterium]